MNGVETLVTRRTISPPAGTILYLTREEILKDRKVLPYLHAMLRAWNDLKLSGILAVDGVPTLYLREEKRRISTAKAKDLQRDFWNQGIATVFALIDPVYLRLYSGLAYPAHPEKDEGTLHSLIKQVEIAQAALELGQLSIELATGQFYRNHQGKFDPQEAVDAYLLENLGAVRDVLTDGEYALDSATAHAFLGRVLFACYLIDRGIVKLADYDFTHGAASLRELIESVGFGIARDRLYKLFEDMREKFNGNMFDMNLAAEKRRLRKNHLEAIKHFLRGDPVKENQRTLGFWAYNFKWIPVETISAIYEDFLEKENGSAKRKAGAYYTPRFLAEMVADVALENVGTAEGKRFLDPACGSGIFLVVLFNRLAAAWQQQNPNAHYRRKAEALLAIIQEQLCGIDKNETACRIACFSLYLTFLDQFTPPDILAYVEKTGRKLPKILTLSVEGTIDFPVIYHDDFLMPVRPLPEADFIIGNPPWAGRGSKQIAHRFMERSREAVKINGICCLLLPSKVFLNKTDAFQAEWLKAVSLDKVVQLADYRKMLFTNARTPCMIARYNNKQTDLQEQTVHYIVPKVVQADLRQGVIPISPEDRKTIPLRNVIHAATHELAPVVWKQHLWGTPRDVKFLDLLLDMPSLGDIANTPKAKKRWSKGQGFQPDTKGTSPIPQPIWWKPSDLFVGARNPTIDYSLLEQDCEAVGDRFKALHRPRDKRLFKAPMVIISQGFDSIAFCDFPVLFQDSLQSIAGPKEDEGLLLFLTAYLRSKLARYFLFHTSANWGTERDKVHLDELMRLPFPLPGSEYAHPDAANIVKKVAAKLRQFKKKLEEASQDVKADGGFSLTSESEAEAKKRLTRERKERSGRLKEELEPLIYQYFDLIDQEIMLVEDTSWVHEPSATPGKRSTITLAQQPVFQNDVPGYKDGLQPYAKTLVDTLNNWAKERGGRERITAAGGVDIGTGLAIVTLESSRRSKPFVEKDCRGELAKAFADLRHTAKIKTGTLDYLRGIIVFDNGKIYLAKPATLINWTRTAALNDATEIFGKITEVKKASK